MAYQCPEVLKSRSPYTTIKQIYDDKNKYSVISHFQIIRSLRATTTHPTSDQLNSRVKVMLHGQNSQIQGLRTAMDWVIISLSLETDSKMLVDVLGIFCSMHEKKKMKSSSVVLRPKKKKMSISQVNQQSFTVFIQISIIIFRLTIPTPLIVYLYHLQYIISQVKHINAQFSESNVLTIPDKSAQQH